MSDANQVSLYGDNAILSSDAPSEADLAMLNKASQVEVRDGDQLVDVTVEGGDEPDEPNEGENEGEPADKPEVEAPEGSDEDIQQKTLKAQTAMDDLGKDLQSKGVDIEALMTEYNAGNGLSDGSYETLAKAGYAKSIVDSIVAGQVAIANSFTNAVLSHAGGAEAFKALSETAPAETRTAFNSAIERGDLTTAKALLDGLKASRATRLGTANKQVLGSPALSAKAVQGFETRQDMTKAMGDSRYGRDPAYTKSVEARVGASKFF